MGVGRFSFLPPHPRPPIGGLMQKDSYGIRWETEDFTRHGFIATYALGKCRCDKCVERWERWSPSRPEIYHTRRKLMKM